MFPVSRETWRLINLNCLSQLRHELERVISERDRLLAESSELGADKATRESERAALRAELREARQREQRLLLDIGDLEDENISLQKQVSALRSSQVPLMLSSLSTLVTTWHPAS